VERANKIGSHSKTAIKQEINTKIIAVQMCLDFGNFG